MAASKPLLAIVTGRPGAGKTTLARELASLQRCPMLSRDEVKEGLVRTMGSPSEDVQLKATDAFFRALTARVEEGLSLVAEAAFQHGVWTSRLEPILAIADVRIVVCDVPAKVARERIGRRAALDPGRERFHPGNEVREEYDPPRIAVPTLEVDTADGYRPQLGEIAEFLTVTS